MNNESPRIIVRRSGPLSGNVQVPGAKNSVLKLMAATLLAEGEYVLTNVPAIADVDTMSDLLTALGVLTKWLGPHELSLTNTGTISTEAPFENVDKIRASINVLGPLLTHYGRAIINWPGGDDFGGRPIDLHISGLEKMGATIEQNLLNISAYADQLHGAEIELSFASVGATENILTAAIYAKGTTVIDNAAREPEIGDLCNMLVAMGAQIEGIGTSRLIIHGSKKGSLQGVRHSVINDRVQAATYIAAVAIAGGDVQIRGARSEQMEMVINKYAQMGVSIIPSRDGLRVTAPDRLNAIDFATLPYPGIATDYKPLLVAMNSVASGVGIVTENLFPGRFRYIEELCKLGADIRIDGHHAVVKGVDHLIGAAVVAPDIRAGAALVVAGLAAHGETVISEIHHIDRGYDDLVGRLSGLGADVTRV
ncbi:MAG: UDP-N-acetylglucosamine 1-carboxyvinyltransferase [Actinobacteria bacterium]|jgi:UDP-N-acetylglucosamine 1-carboxyvinyltransferase|uniref:UDP-N-acetylglucosamine 1-carboxyvinyltransferase n=1 Tax=freshwater metagenome TaxID=449393 RepID=A0A6J6H688_9ZZZZ|nr:UDP-N-acetylglucosamine 1-carboxyvinyltransferase [Actinomycetota bacterium]